MDMIDGDPVVEVIKVGSKERPRWKVQQCPFCGESHLHGYPGLGRRVVHCNIEGRPNSYHLVEKKEAEGGP